MKRNIFYEVILAILCVVGIILIFRKIYELEQENLEYRQYMDEIQSDLEELYYDSEYDGIKNNDLGRFRLNKKDKIRPKGWRVIQ